MNVGVSYLIDRAHYSGVILPGGDWHVLTYSGTTATFVYKIRLVCENHYFNTTCTKFCMARNDKFGHYTCDSNGDKICMDGWMGTNCEMGKWAWLVNYASYWLRGSLSTLADWFSMRWVTCARVNHQILPSKSVNI